MTSTSFDAPLRAQNQSNMDSAQAVQPTSPQNRAKKTLSRRLGTLAVAASVATAGLVAVPAATHTDSASAATISAAEAHAASTVKAKASVGVRITKKHWTKGKAAGKITVVVRAKGAKATGKVKFYAGKKLLKSKALKDGRTTYRLPKSLSAKKHTITVKYLPSGKSAKVVKTTKKAFKIKVLQTEGAKIAAVAKKYVGIRYRSGGTKPATGFDCSGFTSYVFKKAGVAKLPRTSSAQHHAGKRVSRSKARAGDIVWTPGHVAIYLGKGKIIDAPRPGKTIQIRKMFQKSPTFIRV